MNFLMLPKIERSWHNILQGELRKDYVITLQETLNHAYASGSLIYPAAENIFSAFTLCSFANTNVVILGQDPYHNPGQAHGLAFSVPDNTSIPPSLRNIYKEIEHDIGTPPLPNGNLERWATQGVLLLNSTLTVTAGAPGSHQTFGWERFTDAVITTLSTEKDHLVFMLWGAFAQSKATYIDVTKHLVLTASHPSPLSAHRGFHGCRHFSQANTYLKQHGKEPITW